MYNCIIEQLLTSWQSESREKQAARGQGQVISFKGKVLAARTLQHPPHHTPNHPLRHTHQCHSPRMKLVPLRFRNLSIPPAAGNQTFNTQALGVDIVFKP